MPPTSIAQPKATTVTGDPLVIQKVLTNLRRMRYFRRQYDARRAYYFRQYVSQRDQKLYPDNLTPRSNIYFPYPHSQVETVTSRVMDAFFAIDPPIEVRGRSPQDEAAAPLMQTVLLSMLHRCNWTDAIETLVRNIAIYGHAGIKVDWDWDYETVVGPEPIFAMMPEMDPLTGQPILSQTGQPQMLPILNPMTGMPIQLGTKVVTKQIPKMRPKLIPIDAFDLMVDPDGGQVAQLTERTLAQLNREAQENPDLYDPAALAELNRVLSTEKDKDSILIRIAEFWDSTENTVSVMTFGEDAEAVSWKDLRYAYRNASYSSYKRKVFAGNPVLLYHGPNPFMHKRMPILHMSYTKLPNEVYGIGLIEKIGDVSEALNKFLNMIVDNWNLGINRRYAYDVSADIDHTALNNFNVPGGKVGVAGDPSKMIMPLPFFTPQSQDYEIMGVCKNMIEIGSGISDFYSKGVGAPSGNRSATGIGQVVNESNYIFKMFIRNLELQILQPMLEMCASMVQQFVTDDIEYQITNAPPGIPKAGRIPLESIIGNYDFDFVAANYATNKVVKQRNMMAFLNLAMQTPFANIGEFLRETGKVFEIPNINRLIKSDQQVQMEQQQQMAQQVDMMILESMLNTESKARVSQAKPQPAGASKAGKKPGRPATRQFEGKIPGAGLSGPIRSLAQSMGAGGMGLGGLSAESGGE